MFYWPLHQVWTPKLSTIKFKLKMEEMTSMKKKLGLRHVLGKWNAWILLASTFLLKEELKPCDLISSKRNMCVKVCCLVYDTWESIELNNWPQLTKTAKLHLVKSKSVLLIDKRVGDGSTWGVSPAQFGLYTGIPVLATPEWPRGPCSVQQQPQSIAQMPPILIVELVSSLHIKFWAFSTSCCIKIKIKKTLKSNCVP